MVHKIEFESKPEANIFSTNFSSHYYSLCYLLFGNGNVQSVPGNETNLIKSSVAIKIVDKYIVLKTEQMQMKVPPIKIY